MAMTMMGDIQLHANREAVWAKLNDPAVLKSCIPGCEQLDMLSDSEFQAVATVKVGPVKTRWKGKVRLSDFDPPNSYRISGEGDGGVAGFAKGAAKVSLADNDGGTLLSYNVESQIGGKLAQARPAPHQQRGEEDRRRFLRKIPSRRRNRLHRHVDTNRLPGAFHTTEEHNESATTLTLTTMALLCLGIALSYGRPVCV